MAFNDERRRVAATAQSVLGEPAVYYPKTGSSFPTTVIVHRMLSKADLRNRKDEHLTKNVQTATVFATGDGPVTDPRTGDELVLDGSGERFRLDGPAVQRDELKQRIPVLLITS